jgi:hypothetical protein
VCYKLPVFSESKHTDVDCKSCTSKAIGYVLTVTFGSSLRNMSGIKKPRIDIGTKLFMPSFLKR